MIKNWALWIFTLFYLPFMGALPSSISENWYGELDFGSYQLSLALHLEEKSDKTLTAYLFSQDQGSQKIAVDQVNFKGDTLTFFSQAIEARYQGILDSSTSTIKGEFIQKGRCFPLTLGLKPKLTYSRPQSPKPPFPYEEKGVLFTNHKAQVSLSGTLTYPKGKGPFPAALLITGSGAHDRDQTLMGHKTFAVLADYLTRQGLAVLRVDDRGVGKSSGCYEEATTLDLAGDTKAALDFLVSCKEVNGEKIGLIGHSEGGLIASIVASEAQSKASFVVLLAAPGVKGEQILMDQFEDLMKVNGVEPKKLKDGLKRQRQILATVSQEIDSTEKKNVLISLHRSKEVREEMDEGTIEAAIETLMSPWISCFIRLDPKEYLVKVKAPVLALNGDKDLQVSAKKNLSAIRRALKKGKNSSFQTKRLEGLNHLFQTCKTGSPLEYAEIEETMSPAALEVVASWIVDQTGS